MAEFNINNMTLDDNTFEVLPDGDYRFKVVSHEIGYATSDKLPANTQVISCYLEIPYMKDGQVEFAKVRNNLNIYQKAMFAVRQFTDCIGLTPEKGRVGNVNLEDMDGKTGMCALTTYENSNGNEFNNVQAFYAPSKAPVTAINDDAWLKKDGFKKAPEGIADDLFFN